MDSEWYVKLYDLLEGRLVSSGIQNVSPAISPGLKLPGVLPWIGAASRADKEHLPAPGVFVGDFRKVLLGTKVIVGKEEDGLSHRTCLSLVGMIEESLSTWVVPVIGVVTTAGAMRKGSPQLVFEQSVMQDYESSGITAWTVLYSLHLFIEKFEVK